VIEISEGWKKLYPGAIIGILVMRGVENPPRHAGLDSLGKDIESQLRAKFLAGGREALKAHPVLAAYESYYRRFRKTYHVALQLESVVWKNRGIPSVSSMVKAMFMAELSNMLLTAGHDLAKTEPPLRLDVGRGTETYTALGGEQKAVKESDMMISDAAGVISSIIGGPDQRTSISADTRSLLFTVYAPPGIGAPLVRSHLEDLRGYVGMVSPEAVAERMATIPAE